MIIKYCGNCFGRPYTLDVNRMKCPLCGATLQAELAEESALFGRTMLPEGGSSFPSDQNIPGEDRNAPMTQNPFAEDSYFRGKQHEDPFNAPQNNRQNKEPVPAPVPDTTQNKPLVNQFKGNLATQIRNGNLRDQGSVHGKVSQYSSSGREDGVYRRFLPRKIYQAIVYKQRFEDVLHRFTVRVEQGDDAFGYQQYTDIPVNVHGTISGGLQLVDNAEVEVHGKYASNGVLMAESIYIINNGYKSKVGFQRSVKAIVYGILTAIMLAFVCFVAASSNGSFMANLKEFCIVWLVFAGILTLLYLITSLTKIGILTRMFSDKKRSFPLLAILLISLALAFLFVSAFGSFAGFGSYLSGWIYALIPIVVVLVGLFFILKGLF